MWGIVLIPRAIEQGFKDTVFGDNELRWGEGALNIDNTAICIFKQHVTFVINDSLYH